MSALQITRYAVQSEKIVKPLTFALAADLHNGPYEEALPALQEADAILILGDLINRHRLGFENAVSFLRDAPELAPTFYAIGNHERMSEEAEAFWPHVERSRVTVLDNAYTMFEGVVLGGFSSGGGSKADIRPGFLLDMAAQSGFKLLMCHHPEMFAGWVKKLDIDLTVSGHAHGGQVQLLGRGLFAPGQGIFPRLTNGFYDNGRLLVSRGMTNSCGAPRWGNPCELILLTLTGKGAGV